MAQDAQTNYTRLRIDDTESPLMRHSAVVVLLLEFPLARCSRLENHALPRFENPDESLIPLGLLGDAFLAAHGEGDPEKFVDSVDSPFSGSPVASLQRIL